MIVPIPGKYKNTPQKSDNSEVVNPSISSTEIDNSVSSHNPIQSKVEESQELTYFNIPFFSLVLTIQKL